MDGYVLARLSHLGADPRNVSQSWDRVRQRWLRLQKAHQGFRGRLQVSRLQNQRRVTHTSRLDIFYKVKIAM